MHACNYWKGWNCYHTSWMSASIRRYLLIGVLLVFFSVNPSYLILAGNVSQIPDSSYTLTTGVHYCSVFQSRLTLCHPMTAACQASMSFTISQSLLKSCLLSWWYYLTISSSAAPFSSCLQSLPTSGSFPMSWFFTSGGQSIGASASGSVLGQIIDALWTQFSHLLNNICVLG